MARESDILDYAKGKRRGKAAHYLERESLNDPFLADALEGFEQTGDHKQTINDLRKQLFSAKIKKRQIAKSFYSLNRYKIAMAVAAVFLLLLLIPILHTSVKQQKILAVLEDIQLAAVFDEGESPITQQEFPYLSERIKLLPMADNMRDVVASKRIISMEIISDADLLFAEEKKEEDNVTEKIYFQEDAVLISAYYRESTFPLWTEVDEKPKFMNSDDEKIFQDWIQKKIVYPQECVENNIQGAVTLQFIINAEGKVTDVKIVNGINSLLDAEAFRLVRSSPDWMPAKDKGKPLAVSYIVTVNFRL